MGTLWLIRHGQASFGKQEYDALSEKGFRQARAVGVSLKTAGHVFDGVYSGSLKRQIDTAVTALSVCPGCFGRLDPEILPQFNEYDFMSISKGLLPALADEDPAVRQQSPRFFTDQTVFVDLYSRIFMRWLSGRYDVPGIETFKEYRTRVIEGVNTVIGRSGQGARIAVFTSGGVIATLLQHALNLDQETTMAVGWQIRNASITCFDITEGAPVLSSFNATTHLEITGRDLLTYR